ncbi:MAG TPA: hypothetical protein VF721_20855 [Pyrinomonadaceae bacterium]|jgi:hypothetical protein
MIKQKKGFSFIRIIGLAAMALFNITVCSAQTSAAVTPQVEIKNLTIRYNYRMTPEGSATYHTMQGEDVFFIGRATPINLPYRDANPFPFPVQLGTVLTGFNRIIGAKSGGDFDLPQIRFYFDSIESEPVNLLPTIGRKKYETRATGKVRMRGKAEIYPQRILGEPWLPIAADDDLDLVGTYTAYFRIYTEPDGSTTRKARWEHITYNLTQAQ